MKPITEAMFLYQTLYAPFPEFASGPEFRSVSEVGMKLQAGRPSPSALNVLATLRPEEASLAVQWRDTNQGAFRSSNSSERIQKKSRL
jgi:hypothetical protein